MDNMVLPTREEMMAILEEANVDVPTDASLVQLKRLYNLYTSQVRANNTEKTSRPCEDSAADADETSVPAVHLNTQPDEHNPTVVTDENQLNATTESQQVDHQLELLRGQRSVQSNMRDLTCDDYTLINNENSSNGVKIVDPCEPISFPAGGISYTEVDTTGYEHTSCNELNNNNSNKCNGSLLKDIKLELEAVQENFTSTGGDFFSSHETVKSDTPMPSWTQTQCLPFDQTISATINATNTTTTDQDQQSHKNLNKQISPQYYYSNQTNHHHHYHRPHQRHQLLLHGSDDPLISHGADSVINDFDYDHSIEFKHLFTAVNDGQKQQKYVGTLHQQQQQQPNRNLICNKQSKHTSTAPGLVQKRLQNGCSSLTKQQLKMKAGLMNATQQYQQQQFKHSATNQPQTVNNRLDEHATTKAKVTKTAKKKPLNSVNSVSGTGNGVMKLRFHHQALPPEYLNHYEATQRQQKQQNLTNAPSKVAQTAKTTLPKSSHENVRSWLQKIAEIQRTAQLKQQQQQHHKQRQNHQQPPKEEINKTTTSTRHDANNNHQNCSKPDLQTPTLVDVPIIPPQPVTSERVWDKKARPLQPTTTSTKRKMNYAELPYMGEMTLNNSKPRRGRKPKKADICHLIYKNYGTILTDTTKMDREPSPTKVAKRKFSKSTRCYEEPLNLCLRDYKSMDLHSVSSGEGNYGVGEDDEAFNDDFSDCGDRISNCTTPGDATTDAMLATNMKTAFTRDQEINEYSVPKTREDLSDSEPKKLLLRPVTFYYQKLLESGMLLKHNDNGSALTSTIASFAGLPIETIEKDNQIALKIPIPSGFFLDSKRSLKQQPPQQKTNNQPVPVSIVIDYPEPLSTPSSIKSEQSFTTTTTSSNVAGGSSVHNGNSSGNAISIQPNAQAPQKRKRSAIFIPPMPTETSSSNPANEVSICKFKFTGGVKPTLQKKKMLSVDSNGNYRYYSGTRDKSMRGYEFFPRESLQQSGFLPGSGGSSSGAIMNATNDKICRNLSSSPDLNNELLPIPDSSPTDSTVLLCGTAPAHAKSSNSSLTSTDLSNNDHQLNQSHKRTVTSMDSTSTSAGMQSSVNSLQQRKKKSQSSLGHSTTHREKLEKTFQEKGFLIQTQQLESAEGATYCKFRQLKKFTRYLFRNWKDYLPDGEEVGKSQDLSEAGRNQRATIESLLSNHDIDNRDLVMESHSNSHHEISSAEALKSDLITTVERA